MGAGVLSYAFGFITGIIFLFMEPHSQNKTVRFHAFQSILFNGVWVAAYIAMTILSLIISALIGFFRMGSVIMIFNLAIWGGGMAVWILLMVKAYQGHRWKLPILGDLAKKWAGT